MKINYNRITKLSLLLLAVMSSFVLFYKNSATNMISFVQPIEDKLLKDLDKQNLNVLLLAYQRTGSSFMGELLSSHSSVFYVYEPSWKLNYSRNVTEPRNAAAHLRQLYNCELSTLSLYPRSTEISTKVKKSADFYFPTLFKLSDSLTVRQRKKLNVTNLCRAARTKVVKTIRYRMDAVLELIKFEDVDVKIVHLVRDPRAIINSINGHECWDNSTRDPAFQCENLRSDLKLRKQLPIDKYMLVRYEDLINNTLDTAIKVFQFLKLPIHDSLASFIVSHSMQEHLPRKKPTDYFSTKRKLGFRPDHWKKSLPFWQQVNVTKHCADVLLSLAYT